MNKIERVLALSPHPDDAEFGAGGTLRKLVKEGKKVYVVYFSPCQASLPTNYDIEQEIKRSAKAIGFDYKLFNYFVREMPMQRQGVLNDLIKLRKEINPDLVLVPNGNDIHQDHKTVYEEALRAFKFCNVLGWEMIWNNFENINGRYFVELSEAEVKTKIKAIKAYRSQKDRFYATTEYIRGLAVLRGTQINKQYAETFELIRWIT